MITRTSASLAAIFVAMSCLYPLSVSAQEKIDVSGVVAPNCRFCRGSGSARCAECRGYGKSNSIPTPCEQCKGEKTLKCEDCGEGGTVDCKKCKPRKIEGKEVYVVVNPEHKEWTKKFGLKASQIFDPKRRDKMFGQMPAKYIPCKECNGEGKAKCEKCEGTQKASCGHCKGKGTVNGSGSCPQCLGCGKIFCKKCSTLEGFEENEQLASLLNLRKQKVIDEVEYFHKRRLLIAQELFRRKKSALKEEELAKVAKERGEEHGDKPDAAADAQPDWNKRKESLAALTKGADTGVLDFQSYRRKVQELGLAANEVKVTESAANSDKMKRYLKLKSDFRDGKLDLNDFHEQMGRL